MTVKDRVLVYLIRHRYIGRGIVHCLCMVRELREMGIRALPKLSYHLNHMFL